MRHPRETITHGPVTLHRFRAGQAAAAELTRAVTGTLDELRPWMPWAKDGYGLANAEQFLAATEEGWEAGTEFNYAIRSGGELAGGIGLMARIGAGALEIGYWVHAAYMRRGLATAAAAAVTAEAFTLPGISRVEIRHDELNVASGGIPRKLGFTLVGSSPGPDPRPDGTDAVDLVWEKTR
jgi:ribosomal-protein-serine acetyltransferase